MDFGGNDQTTMMVLNSNFCSFCWFLFYLGSSIDKTWLVWPIMLHEKIKTSSFTTVRCKFIFGISCVFGKSSVVIYICLAKWFFCQFYLDCIKIRNLSEMHFFVLLLILQLTLISKVWVVPLFTSCFMHPIYYHIFYSIPTEYTIKKILSFLLLFKS